MRIIIAGGSGFLGRALGSQLQADRHTIGNLTRRPRAGVQDDIAWTPDGSAGEWTRALDGVDVIVNLAGEGIADQRWSDARKQALKNSRVLSTRSLAVAIGRLSRPPAVFVSGSGVGYYGARGDELITEAEPPGSDFLATLCVEWERGAEQASPITRVVLLRTAPVLHPGGGALAKMLTPFRLGLGGPLGTGSQFMPWIHLADWVDLVVWLIRNGNARGAFNASAPEPVTNAEFTRTLGGVLHRPAIIPVPGFGLRLLVGELADSLLTGQRAVPARAGEMGFVFRFPRLESALRDLLN